MKKALRTILRIILGLLSILVLAWLILAGYALLKGPALIREAGTELNRRMGGVEFRSGLEISFFHDFPHINLRLSNVLLRDSLWQDHHHTLVEAKEVFVRFAPLSLFSGRPQVSKLFFKQGTVYLFTDSTGYSNVSVLHRLDWGRKPDHGPGRDQRGVFTDAVLPDLSFDQVRVTIEKDDTIGKRELFDLHIRSLDCTIKKTIRSLQLRVNMNMRVNTVSLDAKKENFLKDKDLSGRFDLQFNTASKILEGKQVNVSMDGQEYLLSGRFFADVSPDPFLLSVQAQSIPFPQAVGLFPLHIREKLFAYDIKNPVSLKLTLDAGAADKPYPQVTAGLTVGGKEDRQTGVLDHGAGEGLSIHFKGPLYESDSIPALGHETLDLDSAGWAPFKKALKK